MMASQSCELKKHVLSIEEVVTYFDAPNKVVSRLDLGSADLILFETEDGKKSLAITTSSGHAALLPAEFFASLV